MMSSNRVFRGQLGALTQLGRGPSGKASPRKCLTGGTWVGVGVGGWGVVEAEAGVGFTGSDLTTDPVL